MKKEAQIYIYCDFYHHKNEQNLKLGMVLLVNWFNPDLNNSTSINWIDQRIRIMALIILILHLASPA